MCGLFANYIMHTLCEPPLYVDMTQQVTKGRRRRKQPEIPENRIVFGAVCRRTVNKART